MSDVKLIKIFNASKKDELFFFKLRNKNYIKDISINKSKISYENHKKWFLNQFNSKNKLFIIKKLRKIIGYLRLNYISKNLFEVSIAINKEFHNRNIGSIALNQIEKKFLQQSFEAKVLYKNNKSVNFFKKNNYKIFKKTKNFFVMRKKSFIKEKIKIIDQIKNVRSKNNINWMEILKVAFKHAPDESSKILGKIFQEDKKITKLTKKLTKN
jgi:hypothetical protein